MDDILGFIIPAIAVMAWLFGLFKSEDQKKQEQPKSQPPRQSRENKQTTLTRAELEKQAKTNSKAQTDNSAEMKDFKDQKQNQIEQMRDRLQLQSKESLKKSKHDAIKGVTPPKKVTSKSQMPSSLTIRNQLTTKGIAQSVVMAEVLGPPKARQPKRKINGRIQ
ncbi:hypothetical protein [Saliterribacillus persicus]|uniref:Uncharacterized protein n=1 Tax=Saliterribacillus persicus TaxID=930114 RepID=A0A368XBJ8_9BACI|nr:hypothetical protein [Saliterribacillus persicus]RCW65330.1 hypothetical protein DFR57_11158 [Saliterribacillus persicus]